MRGMLTSNIRQTFFVTALACAFVGRGKGKRLDRRGYEAGLEEGFRVRAV